MKAAWAEELPTQTINIMSRVTIMGKNRPRRPDMQGIVAQQESKGHGSLTTVPLKDYGVAVTVGVISDVTAGVTSGVTDPVATGVLPAPGVGVAGERAAASVAVLGMPAVIHAW